MYLTLNYTRRDDYPDFVEHIRSWFAWMYGSDNVFMDISGIGEQATGPLEIREQVEHCDVLLAIVGPTWLSQLHNRLSRSDDGVRIQIKEALKKKKLVIPIYIKGANDLHPDKLPRELRGMLNVQAARFDSGENLIARIVGTMDSIEAQLNSRVLRKKKLLVREIHDGVEYPSTRPAHLERDLFRQQLPQRRTEGSQSKPQSQILRVVVASPGDVQPERDVVPCVIDEVNRVAAADRGLHLELSRWETDTHPGFHTEGPQGLIDPILKITDCDLLIGIFWKRFGTPTADGLTGTEHEFSLARKAWQEKGSPQIFFYFNQKPYAPKSKAEAEQWGQVLDFRDRFPQEGFRFSV